jgi:hypothetical protein
LKTARKQIGVKATKSRISNGEWFWEIETEDVLKN